MRLLGEAYEYQVKFSREAGLVCLLIGVAIIAVLAAIIVFVDRKTGTFLISWRAMLLLITSIRPPDTETTCVPIFPRSLSFLSCGK